jgi:hypothetical protein
VLDEVGLEGISTVPAQESLGGEMLHPREDIQGSGRKSEGSLCVD